ncbi:hypothetical protein CK203_030160 [Vitis vinifera]|uniref:Uncharacterized protein n=1 Tax=Vitis vinifera TaxID=29760 RepID=A0A438I5H9_VITVI|nr:hypothetical protein CK203_030160 [Vitis vinifera]
MPCCKAGNPTWQKTSDRFVEVDRVQVGLDLGRIGTIGSGARSCIELQPVTRGIIHDTTVCKIFEDHCNFFCVLLSESNWNGDCKIGGSPAGVVYLSFPNQMATQSFVKASSRNRYFPFSLLSSPLFVCRENVDADFKLRILIFRFFFICT